MAILVLSDWEISSVTLAGKAANYAATITVPENYEVTVNTIPLTAEEKTGDAKVMDGFEYVAEYVTPPKSVTYKVEGLINMPVITVNGRTVEESELDIKDGKITYNGGFDSEEIGSELRDYVLNAAKTYTNFFSKKTLKDAVTVQHLLKDFSRQVHTISRWPRITDSRICGPTVHISHLYFLMKK